MAGHRLNVGASGITGTPPRKRDHSLRWAAKLDHYLKIRQRRRNNAETVTVGAYPGCMPTVRLPDELVERLAVEASRRGVSLDEFVTETLTARFPSEAHPDGPRRHLAFVAIGASGHTRGGAEADELLSEGFGRD